MVGKGDCEMDEWPAPRASPRWVRPAGLLVVGTSALALGLLAVGPRHWYQGDTWPDFLVMFAASALVVASVVDVAARDSDGLWSWRQLRSRSAGLCALALILLVVMSVIDPVATGVWPEGDSAQGFSMFTFVGSLGVAITAAIRTPRDLGVTQPGWDSLSGAELARGRVRIALRRFPLLSRESYVDVDRSGATLVIPRVFGGRRRWFIPLDEMGVVWPAHGNAIDKVLLNGTSDGEWVTRNEFRVPYMATTSSLLPPNLILLFTVPQPVLPIRWSAGRDLDLSWRQTRKQPGVRVDGVGLRAVDPEAARQALTGQGVRPVFDANAFVAQYREVVRDPREVRGIVARRRRSALLLACCGFAMFALFIAYNLTDDSRYVLGMAAAVVLSWVLEWTHRRRTP
jgi:hypothetical protein